MIGPKPILRNNLLATVLVSSLVITLILAASVVPGHAQERRSVQILTQRIEAGELHFYQLPDLNAGETLSIYATGTSSNFDPFIALFDGSLEPSVLEESFIDEVEQAIANGQDPFVVLPQVASSIFVAWDDDSGGGYDAVFSKRIPEDGDYQLMVSSSPGRRTFGDYKLLIGINAPEVLTGDALPTDDGIAVLDRAASEIGVAVQEMTGSVTVDKPSSFLTLNPIEAGDTLYIYIEATSGDLAPIIRLQDFGRKTLRTGNLFGEQPSATLEFTFPERGSNYVLEISGCCEEGGVSEGEYRLLAGVNTPEVLMGEAATNVKPVFLEPTEVQVGVKLEQITDVDQVSENFSAVASIKMSWVDPKLAFRPDSCQCSFKVLTLPEFRLLIAQNGTRWPEFSILNQQDNRWTQNQNIVVFTDGKINYIERFTTILQAPDFDFRQYPFDTQEFFIRILSLYPEEFYILQDLEGFSEVGENTGEEEWLITDFNTAVDSLDSNSQFSFRFQAQRHIDYYVLRIFAPILLIIFISWITFFLKDYGKRIDIGAGNLLLFIAFNFTISDDLPRLGYMTFMDAVLIGTFSISVLIVTLNVFYKRLENRGRGDLAQRIDNFSIWFFLVAYIVAWLALKAVFS
ncbi:MAG: hypothetical protein E3J69_05650 [Anaerolineales bacterium]|nr:MAG: hypothetical protein E3J69_05650 [Anaerolineales bacterium]